jgi:tetratricopeptide (TPR) repeat protein
VRIWFEWDWAGGEAELRRAIELNPSDALARMGYAHLLAQQKRFDASAEQREKGLELDPLNPTYQVMAAVQLSFAGHFDEATSRLRTTLAQTPGFGLGHVPLWILLD